MDKKSVFDTVSFLKELMYRRHINASQLAAELGISHSSISRWLNGKVSPDVKSCYRLSEYSGVPLNTILSITHNCSIGKAKTLAGWPEFREYARIKYPIELDEDIVTMIEALIDRRRARMDNGKTSNRT